MSLCTSTTVACYVFSSLYGIRIVPWCIEGRSPHLTSACTAKCATEVWEGCDISSILKILSFSGLTFLAAEGFSAQSLIEQRSCAIVANTLWSWILARLDCVCALRVRSFVRNVVNRKIQFFIPALSSLSDVLWYPCVPR
jgi:hypothetical protein